MAHMLSGFSVGNRKTTDATMTEAARALAEAHKQVIALQRQGAGGRMLQTYKLHFGTLAPARLRRVTEVIGLMDFALNSSSISIEYNISCGAMTNAAAFAPDGGWSVQTIKDSLRSGRFRVSLCPRFFQSMSQNDRMQQNRTGTFIHELSHILGNTNDVGANHLAGAPITAAPVGFTYYGRAAARQLADRHPDLAVENAENYGFYCSDLLDQMTAPAEADLSGLQSLFG